MKTHLLIHSGLKLFILISFIYFPFNLYAQSYTQKISDIYFEKLTTEDGLSSNVIKCIFQDSEGFIWFGTADGLNRYDGRTFKIFRNEPANLHSISGNIITGIAEDKTGLLWITTQDGGLSCYNRNAAASKQFDQYKHDPKNASSVPANNLNALTIDKKGDAWVASESNGIFKMDVETKKIRDISNLEVDTINNGHFTYGCDVLKTDDEGKVWCGSYGELVFRLDPASHTTKTYRYFESATGVKVKTPRSVHSLLPADNILWFAHRFGALDKFNYTTNKFESYELEPEAASEKRNDQWISMEKDINGNIWLGSKKNGCYVFDPITNKYYNFSYDVFDPGSLSDNTTNCLYKDKTGILWIGTNKGVCKYDKLANQVKYHHIKDEKRPGLTNLNIYDFYEADNGSFWLASDGGLFIRDKNAFDFKCKYSNFQDKPLVIYKFIKGTDGKVYLITNSNNFIYNSKNDLLTRLPFFLAAPVDSNGNEYSYRSSIKTAVVADTLDVVYYKTPGPNPRVAYFNNTPKARNFIRDTLRSCPIFWVGSRGWGVYQYYSLENYCCIAYHQISSYSDLVYLSNNLVQSILKDKNGTIWVATDGGGLNKIKNKSHYFWDKFFYYQNEPSNPYSLSSNSISDMCLDKDGIFWITTYDGVLNRFDPDAKDKKYFRRITGTDDLSRQSMFSILCDAKNNLWIATASAILKYDIRTNTFLAWKLKEQLPYDQYPGKKYIGKDGTIYFGGNKFYISFHPDSLLTNSAIPKVVITSFKIYNDPADDLLLNKEIKLEHEKNFFTFEFAALNFSNPAENKFAYKLDGVDKDWVYIGNKNSASYTSLRYGTYTFYVKASNNDDVWNEKGVSVKVIILPAWWQTGLFRIAVLLVILSIIFFSTRYYFKQKIKLQQQQLEKQKAVESIRSKISMDIHDEIGAQLTKISLLSQRMKLSYHKQKEVDELLINKITESSTEVVDNLGEIIWAVNPKHDNLQSLLSYLRNYITNFFEQTNVDYMIDFPEEIPTITISPELKHNLFLVVKEALNNIIKHATATEVKVMFAFNDAIFCFEITDNGKGIADLNGRDFGNGLINMKNRMQAVNGSFEIMSEINKGTTIQLKGIFNI